MNKSYSIVKKESNATLCDSVCVNCWNLLHPYYLEQLTQQIFFQCSEQFPLVGDPLSWDTNHTIELNLNIPSSFDIPRIIFRSYLTNTTDKVISFATFDTILHQYLTWQLQSRYGIVITSSSTGEYIIDLKLIFTFQYPCLEKYYSTFQSSKATTARNNLRNKYASLQQKITCQAKVGRNFQ